MNSMTTQFETRWMTSLRWIPISAAVIQMVIGSLVLGGWAFKIPLLQSLLPELTTMKPLTAVGNILAGIALWHLRSATDPSWQKTLGQVCASLVIALGGLLLLEYLFNPLWNIELWLFAEAVLAEGGTHPGRPSPTTAFCLVLLGWAIFMLDKRPNWLSALLALVILFINGLAIVGYAYGVGSLYQIGPYSPTALHTAVLFILGAVGCLFARPTQAFMGVIHSQFIGGQMARRLLPAAFLVPFILGWLRLQGELAGWYEMRFGLALFASSNIVLFTSLLFWNAYQLNQEDVQRAALHDSLRASEERFAKIFHSSPTAISIARIQTGEIIEVNEACLQLLGYTRAEVIGRTAVELGITKAGLRQQAIEEIKHLGTMRNREGVIYARTGEARNVVISLETSTLNGELCSLTSMFDITERKRAEEVLRLNEEHFRLLTNAMPNGLIMVNPQGQIKLANKQANLLFGYESGQLADQMIETLVPAKFRERHMSYRTGFMADPQSRPMGAGRDLFGLRYDGTEFPIEIGLNPITTGEGQMTLVSIIDITERKQAEEALRLNTVIMENIATGIYLVRASDGTIVYTNPGFDQLFGYEHGELIGQPVSVINAPADKTPYAIANEIIAALKKDKTWEGEVYSRRKDGTSFWCHASISTFEHTEYGTVWVAARQDISERKQAEALLHRQARLLELAHEPIVIWQLGGGILFWNRGAEQLYGFSSAEALGQVSHVLLATEHPLGADKFLALLEQTGEWQGELTHTRRDGTRIIVESRQQLLRDETGTWLVLETNRDITERKRAETEVQLSQARLEAGENLVNLGSWELAVGSQQGWWSKQMFRMMGFDPAQGVPSFEAYLDVVHPEDRDLILNALMQMARGEQPPQQEFRRNPEHGPLRYFSPTYRVEYDAEGRPAKFIGTLLDITERKNAEMLIAASLQEKEVLLKEIHHRVKNNLQVITSLLRLQADGLTDPHIRELLTDNQRRVRSMALIHEQLYQAQDLAHINFGDYVTRLVNYLWRLYAPTQPNLEAQVRIEGVTLEVEQAMPLGLIVNELVSNSMRHAFPAETTHGPQTLWVSAVRETDGFLHVEVGDTGVGLPESFDIEQTTSMGLQLVQAFVLQLRGQLQIHNHPGTQFKMTFPQT